MKLSANEIWIGFTKFKDEAECNICRARLKRCGSQTTSLHYHLVNKHEDEMKYVQKHGRLEKPSSLEDFFDVRRKLNKTRVDSINNALVKLITKSNLSLRIVTTPEFLAFVRALNSSYTPPTPTTLTHIIKENVEGSVQRGKLMLKNKKLSITADEWSLLKKEVSIFAIRAFFVQKERKCSITLSCIPMEGHDAEAYVALIRSCFEQYEIEAKNVISFTTDAGSALKKAVKSWIADSKETIAWIHCFPHRLHLTIQNGLKFSTYYKDLVEAIHKFTTDVHSTWKNHKIFKNLCSSFNEAVTLPPKYVATRWNSLAHTLRHLVDHKDSVLAYQIKRDLPLIRGTLLEFGKEMSNIFDAFAKCSQFCCRETALLSEGIGSLIVLRNTLEAQISRKFQLERQELLSKFDYYFKDDMSNEMYLKYMLLDPRLAFDLNVLNLQVWQNLIKAFPIKEKLKKTYTTDHPLGHFGGEDTSSEMEEYSKLVSSCRPHKATDIFLWWAQKGIAFPSLHTYFLKLCVSSPSSCDVERLFSSATWLYSQKKRNRLLPTIASNLLFLSSTVSDKTAEEDEENVKEDIMDRLYKKDDQENSSLTQAINVLGINDVPFYE